MFQELGVRSLLATTLTQLLKWVAWLPHDDRKKSQKTHRCRQVQKDPSLFKNINFRAKAQSFRDQMDSLRIRNEKQNKRYMI